MPRLIDIGDVVSVLVNVIGLVELLREVEDRGVICLREVGQAVLPQSY